jgi:hypothetical protein
MTIKRIFGIILALCLVPMVASAQADVFTNQIQLLNESFHRQGLVGIGFFAVALCLMVLFLMVIIKLFRRSILGMSVQKTDQYRARHEQHMERVEQSLERIAKALEKPRA